MANDTRSGRKNKDEEGSSTKKKSVDSKKLSTSGLGKSDNPASRKSASETSPSPLSTRKSERLEKRTPHTPTVKRKSERIEKQNSPSPVRRSERGKKDGSSSSLGSKNSTKRSNLSDVKQKEKREKSLTQLTAESAKISTGSGQDRGSVGEKRKRMDARSYKALFRAQRRRDTAPGIVDKLDRIDVLSEVDCGVSQESVSKQMDSWEDKGNDFAGEVADETRDGCLGVADEAREECLEVADETRDECLEGAEETRDEHFEAAEITGEECLKRRSEEDTGRSSSSSPSSVADVSENGVDVELLKSRSGDSLVQNSHDGKILCPLFSQSTSPSTEQEGHVFWGTCGECSKERRVKHDSPNLELCTCNVQPNKVTDDNSCCKGREDLEATITPEISERLESSVLLERPSVAVQVDGHKKLCVVCNQDEELLFCDGKGCQKCYHLSCLDPSLEVFPPGIWHCIWCVKKKVELGVHSVSKGVESIWDSRKVEVSDSKGKQCQKQYLVKYQGLAHVHNHWIPEKVLLSEASSLVDKFNRKQQGLSWNSEWTVPHRLIKKRLLNFPRQQEDCKFSVGNTEHCQYEWLVKWCDLGYEDATWELENAYFLHSSLGQKLLREFEIRHEKAKRMVDKCNKTSYVKLTKLPSGGSPVTGSNLLNHVNKLREFWYKCQNAVVFDDQDRVRSAIFFILSLSEIACPFLVIATSEAFSRWEAEFMHLAPSVNLVVYAGNKNTRRSIRALEFYEEGGPMMLQVLLSYPEAVLEDLHILRQLSWGAILIDECHSRICTFFEPMKVLTTDSRVVVFTSQLKETVADHLSILSVLDSSDLGESGSLKCDSSDSLNNLKERLSRFIAYSCKSESTKFVEYWIPVQITNLQLEQYCATLLSNSTLLCSSSKNDPVGALQDILLTVRKCCDHPYMVDPSLLRSTHSITEDELLDLGLKASAKLQLLDMILSEIKARKLRVLILYQSFAASGTSSLGNILDDYVYIRFGKHSYERVDACVVPSKKQAACNMFNNKDSGRFIFLLENRACFPSIKLSSVDTVVIFGSDWNPGNDLRALQRISIDSQFQQIKVFRLYAACTVEEKVLILAKQDVNLENSLQSIGRSTTDTLLRWGAFYLFHRLEKYHASNNQTSPPDISSGELLAVDVLKEFLAILTEDYENKDTDKGVISKAQQTAGVYGTNCPLFGERNVKSTIGEEPHIFWRKLLEGRNPQWRYSCCPTPRNRKRVQYFDGSSRNPETDVDAMAKKRRKAMNSGVNLSPTCTEPTAGTPQVISVNQSLPGSTVRENGSISLNHASKLNSHGTSLAREVNPDEPGESLASNGQKSLHILLKTEIAKLCELLALPDDVKHILERFLEYVMENHRVSKEPTTILQALQISLCWIAASIARHKMDKKDSLMLAKQRLNFKCTEQQVDFVYMKLRMLKKKFLQQPEVINDLKTSKYSTSAAECVKKESSDTRAEEREAVRLRNMKSEKEVISQILEERPEDQKHADEAILLEKDPEFLRIWGEKKSQLEKEYRVEVAVIRSIHGQNSVRTDKLKLLEISFAEKMKELEHQKETRAKDLNAKKLAARDEERQKSLQQLPEMRHSGSEPGTSDEVHMHASGSGNNIGGFQATAHASCNGAHSNTSVSGQHVEEQNLKEMVNELQASDAAPPPVDATDDALGYSSLLETRSVSRSPHSTDKEPNEVGHACCSSEEFVSAKHRTSYMETHDMTSSDEQNGVVPADSRIAPGDVMCAYDADVNEAVVQFDEEAEHGDRINSDVSDYVGKNQKGEAERSIICNIPSSEQLPLKAPIGEAIDTTDHAMSVPSSQAPQDEASQHVISAEAQDLEDHPLQEGCLISTEVQNVDQLGTANESIAAADVAPSSAADAGTAQSYSETAGEQLEPVVASSSLGYFQSQDGEDANQACDGSVPFQASESTNLIGELEISHQDLPRPGENMGTPSTDVTNPNVVGNQPDLQPVNSIHEPNGGLPITSQEGGAPSCADRHRVEPLNHAVLPPGCNMNDVQAPFDYPVHRTYQVDWRGPSQNLHPDPLQNELERLRKEAEQAIKGHEDMKLQLRSDCEKEIEEVAAQIRKKYEAKLQDAEAEFLLKKKELDSTVNRVFLNKILAEAVRSKCLDLRPSGLSGIHQGMPPGFMQHMHQLTLQSTLRPSAVASPSSAARPSAPQQNTASTVLTGPRSAALSAAVPSRPPHISAITPSTINMRVGGELRAPAPHLQPFRPSVSASATNIASLPRSMPSQQVPPPSTPSLSQLAATQPSELPSRLSSQPVPPPSSPSLCQLPPTQPSELPSRLSSQPAPQLTPPSQANQSGSHIRPTEPEGGVAATRHTHPSAVQLLVDINRQSAARQSNILTPSVDAGSNFVSVDQSDLGTSGRVQNSVTTSALHTDIVCLSDDE